MAWTMGCKGLVIDEWALVGSGCVEGHQGDPHCLSHPSQQSIASPGHQEADALVWA